MSTTGLSKVIDELKTQESTLIAESLKDDLPQEKVGELRATARLTRKTRELLEDPDAYAERLSLRAQSLMRDASGLGVSDEERILLNTEAQALIDTANRVLREKSRIPKLTQTSLAELKKLAKDLETAAKARVEAVKKIDGIVSTASTILSWVAKAIPLAALAA